MPALNRVAVVVPIMEWTDHTLEHFSASTECLKWINFGLSRCTSRRSAAGGYTDENDAKADVSAEMSAGGGGADVVCQELSGPFIARRRHSPASKFHQHKG